MIKIWNKKSNQEIDVNGEKFCQCHIFFHWHYPIFLTARIFLNCSSTFELQSYNKRELPFKNPRLSAIGNTLGSILGVSPKCHISKCECVGLQEIICEPAMTSAMQCFHTDSPLDCNLKSNAHSFLCIWLWWKI